MANCTPRHRKVAAASQKTPPCGAGPGGGGGAEVRAGRGAGARVGRNIRNVRNAWGTRDARNTKRRLGGRRGGPYLALCGLCGAAVLLAADLPARLLNLPLSIFTVAAAVPVLLALLVRQGRGGEDDA